MKKIIKKLKNSWNQNRVLFVLTTILIVCLVLIFIVALDYFFGTSKDKYGDRLDGIEEHPIKNEDIESVKSKVKESKKVNDITYSLEGRLMKFAIDVKKGTDKESIESLGETILSSLSDDIKDYYDIQLIVNCKEDSKFVPLIASKHKTRKVFVW